MDFSWRSFRFYRMLHEGYMLKTVLRFSKPSRNPGASRTLHDRLRFFAMQKT